MKSLRNVFILVILPSITFAITSINDTQIYKPCMVDVTECPSDQVCFQYFCYPKNADANQPLQSCKRPSECEAFNDTKSASKTVELEFAYQKQIMNCVNRIKNVKAEVENAVVIIVAIRSTSMNCLKWIAIQKIQHARKSKEVYKNWSHQK